MHPQIKIIFTFLILCNSILLHAQENEYYQMTDSDHAYREFRQRATTPPYGLDKVKGLIKDIQYKAHEYGDSGISALSATQFKSLSLREKFTYVMIHAEMYAQNCAIMMPLPEEHNKIFAHLLVWVDEEEWSDRQINFLRENRDSIMNFIKESTTRSGHMGVNYKAAIDIINGWEMIPFIIDYYHSKPKDKDALTLLLLLMKKGEYVDFIQSSSYKKLYDHDNSYEAFIQYNKANEDLILKRANGYYNEKKQNR